MQLRSSIVSLDTYVYNQTRNISLGVGRGHPSHFFRNKIFFGFIYNKMNIKRTASSSCIRILIIGEFKVRLYFFLIFFFAAKKWVSFVPFHTSKTMLNAWYIYIMPIIYTYLLKWMQRKYVANVILYAADT